MQLTAANTAIVLDSTADFPDAPQRYPNFRVVPLYVRFGDESFRDYVDLGADAFYERLRSRAETADDVAADAGRLPRRLRGARGLRADALLTIASKLSGHVRQRRDGRRLEARRRPRPRARLEDRVGGDRDARARDPAPARARHDRRGGRRARRALPRARRGLLFTVSTLEYLARGGRIGKAAAFAGDAAEREADPRDPGRRGRAGEARARERRRRSRSSRRRSRRRRRDDAGPARRDRARGRARAARGADELVRHVRPQARRSSMATMLGAVVGTHAGPGTVGFFWFHDTDCRAVRAAATARVGAAPRLGRVGVLEASLLHADSDAAAGGLRRRRTRPGLAAPRGRPRRSGSRSARHAGRRRPDGREAARAGSGSRTVGDLLLHRPRRYEARRRRGRDRRARSGDEEVAIAGVVRRTSSRPRRGRLTILEARVADATGSVRAAWFNQPWLAEKLQPGTRVRLRGQLKRGTASTSQSTTSARRERPPTSRRSTRRARTCRRRSCASSRTRRSAARARSARPAAGRAQAARAPAAARRRARRAPLSRARTRRPRRARRRLAFDELLVLQLGLVRRRRERESARRARARRAGRAGRALPRGAAVRADRAPGAGDRRDRRRPRADGADAAAAAGRRRLGQDGRRALRAAARRRGGPAGRADGADRDARRAALPDGRGVLPRARRPVRAADELGSANARRRCRASASSSARTR